MSSLNKRLQTLEKHVNPPTERSFQVVFFIDGQYYAIDNHSYSPSRKISFEEYDLMCSVHDILVIKGRKDNH